MPFHQWTTNVYDILFNIALSGMIIMISLDNSYRREFKVYWRSRWTHLGIMSAGTQIRAYHLH